MPASRIRGGSGYAVQLRITAIVSTFPPPFRPAMPSFSLSRHCSPYLSGLEYGHHENENGLCSGLCAPERLKAPGALDQGGLCPKSWYHHDERMLSRQTPSCLYRRERAIIRHRPYLYSRQDLIAPLRAVADPKRVFPTCPGTGRFAVFLSPELNFTEGFCSEVPVPNG